MKNKFHAMFMIGLIISLPIYTSTVFADSGVIEYKTVLLNGVGNPEQVQNLISTSVSYDSVSFSWDAVDPENFSYYKVYRSNIHVANTTDTSYTDDGVEPETSYSYQVSTVDIFEIEGEKSATLSVTTPASPYPIHSEPHYTAVDILDARITWITNIPADSKVEYGLEQTLGEQVSSENLVLEHSILLDELEPDKMYFYKVTSCSDVYCTSSEIRNFTTPHYQLPFINVTIPRYYQLASMNIHGKTTPGTESR